LIIEIQYFPMHYRSPFIFSLTAKHNSWYYWAPLWPLCNVTWQPWSIHASRPHVYLANTAAHFGTTARRKNCVKTSTYQEAHYEQTADYIGCLLYAAEPQARTPVITNESRVRIAVDFWR